MFNSKSLSVYIIMFAIAVAVAIFAFVLHKIWLVALLGFFISLTCGLLGYQIFYLLKFQDFQTWLQSLHHKNSPPPKSLGHFQSAAHLIYTAQYQKSQQITTSHQQLNQIYNALNALTDAIILIDKDDVLQWWNQAAGKLLNLQPHHQDLSILNLIRNPKFHEYYQQNQEDNIHGIRLNIGDDHCFFQCEISRFHQEKLLVLYDVSQLQRLEQMRKDFVANVSHELRTPLTVIMGYVETLSEQSELDPKWQRAFQQILQQSTRMNHIIHDLLLLSRLENDTTLPEPLFIDMPKLLSQLFDDIQIYNKNFEHLIHLQIDSQRCILGYEKYLRSALSNLIINAIKYTPNRGEIVISWFEREDGMCFSVADNGIGIEKRHIERLTERFYRVDTGRSRSTGGTGLGLAIVKHVLYQHKATLDIQSKVGQGSIFTVFFPQTCLI